MIGTDKRRSDRGSGGGAREPETRTLADLSFATVLRVLTEMQAIVFVTCQSPRHLAGKDRCFQMTIRNVPMHANGTRAEF